MNKQREFWSTIARHYDRVVDRQLGGATRALVRDRVAREDLLGTLVELGCGSGFYTEILSQRADRVVATDLSPGMLALASHRIAAPNVTFQEEDCQRTSFPDRRFDTAFVSLVMHFTEPGTTVAEMHRILKPGGLLLIANLDLGALRGLDRVRSLLRVAYQGVVGYRVKPPKRFGGNVLTASDLGTLLDRSGFAVLASETIRDPARSSNTPVDYVRATRV